MMKVNLGNHIWWMKLHESKNMKVVHLKRRTINSELYSLVFFAKPYETL